MRIDAANWRFEKIVSFAAWAALLFVAYCTLSPLQQRPGLPAPVSIEHIGAFALLGVLFRLAYPRHGLLVCAIVLGSAMMLEVLQLITPDRHARAQDALEKIVGGTVGIAAGGMISCIRQVARSVRE